MTVYLAAISRAQRGGLQFAPDDLSFAEWCAIGIIRDYNAARDAMLGMMENAL